MGKLQYILILLIAGLPCLAQEQLTRRQQADRLFERYEYFNSLKVYLSIPEKNKDPYVKERIAECYLRMNNYREAEKWYAQLFIHGNGPLRALYNYAEVLQINRKFEEAKTQYRKYYTQTRNNSGLNQKIASCDSAAVWLAQKSDILIKNEELLNSEFSDWGLVNYGSELVFVSDRKKAIDTDVYSWNGNGWTNLFTAKDSVNQFPVRFNTDYHLGPAIFSATLDTAYITVTNQASKRNIAVDQTSLQRLFTRRLELMIATQKDGQWSISKPFRYNDPDRYSVGHAALSPDGRILYFTSDMPGGQGKTDIWYCEKQSDGTWGQPVNAGKMINTAEEEVFPTMDSQGNLYFSSRGLPGMGGYDIFKAEGSRSEWSKPLNLKYPINSTADDFWLNVSGDRKGHFSSNREGGAGSDDIYSFTPKESPDVNKPAQQISEHTPALTIGPLLPGRTFVLRNIYYDLDKSDIRPDAAAELDRLAEILIGNPGLKIELSSHTDSRASDKYNLLLSQRRADAAVNYLVSRGIAKERLVARGYGEEKLLNRCTNGENCSEGEHQLNRRTEFTVLENTSR